MRMRARKQVFDVLLCQCARGRADLQSVRLDLINEVTEGQERAEITKDSVYSHGPRNLSKARRQVGAQKK